MMNVSVEIKNRWSSPMTYVAAIQLANAIAACPDGSPPRSGVPRPVHAFVAITRRMTRTRATSVSEAGAVPTRARTRVARGPAAGPQTGEPPPRAVADWRGNGAGARFL